MPLPKLVKLPEVCLFTAGLAATAWDQDGRPTEWSEWSEADLKRMAANDAHLRRTGQPAPYINAAHFTEAIPGYVGPLRFAPGTSPSASAPKGRPARIYAEVWAEDWIAEQVLAGRRPWRSVEVTKHAEAADFHGISGPVLRGLALLNTHPRRKNLDSVAYGEANLVMFQEPASAGCFYLTTYQETSMPNMEQILAALQALDGDTEKLAAVAEALGLGGAPEEPAVAADPTAEPTPEEQPAAPPAMMSEMANLRRQNAELAKRLTASEAKAARDAQVDRAARVATFGEQLTEAYGKARADKALAIVQARLAAIPAVEVYSENGERHDDLIFGEVLEAMGEPTVAPLTRPGAVGKRPSAPRTETFAEAQAAIVEEARSNKDAASVLLNPAFKGAVQYLARKRLATASRS